MVKSFSWIFCTPLFLIFDQFKLKKNCLGENNIGSQLMLFLLNNYLIISLSFFFKTNTSTFLWTFTFDERSVTQPSSKRHPIHTHTLVRMWRSHTSKKIGFGSILIKGCQGGGASFFLTSPLDRSSNLFFKIRSYSLLPPPKGNTIVHPVRAGQGSWFWIEQNFGKPLGSINCQKILRQSFLSSKPGLSSYSLFLLS